MSNNYIEIRIKRNEAVALLVSLLVHFLALFWLSRQDLLNMNQSAAEQPQPITVRLNPLPAPEKPSEVLPPPAPPAPVVPPQVKRKSPPRPPPPRPAESPSVIATPEPEPAVSMPPKTAPAPAKTPAPLDPAKFPDMASYVQAMRERRRFSGEDPGQYDSPSTTPSRQMSEDEARMATIKRNLQQSGTNGIFQITSIDARSATFSFRGWKSEYSFSRREEYLVNASLKEDIEHAIVRKMIEIIRRYYSGDFNWDSQRLGRIVVLSARPEDNDGLEDFMIQEFFGMQGISAR